MRKKKIYVAVITLLILALVIAAVLKVYVPILKLADNPEEFRQFLEAKGFWGIAVFIIITAVQPFLAFIPAGPLEAASGYCFGSVKGALICDIGLTIGSMSVFLLVRRFGMAFIEVFTSREKIESLKFLKTGGQSKLIIFLIYLIPGSPKDIMAYAVGLTDLNPLWWLLFASVGRLPSILFSTMSGDALIEGQYRRFIVIIVLFAVLALAGGIIYRIWVKKKNMNESEGS